MRFQVPEEAVYVLESTRYDCLRMPIRKDGSHGKMGGRVAVQGDFLRNAPLLDLLRQEPLRRGWR